MGSFLRTVARDYNDETDAWDTNREARIIGSGFEMHFPCTVKDLMDKANGKYGKQSVDTEVIMEFGQMFPFINDYLPR